MGVGVGGGGFRLSIGVRSESDVSKMRKFGRVLGALIVCVLGWAYICAPVAQAASGDEITRFGVDATVGADGVLDVTMSFDVHFASYGHGPYVWFLTRQKYDENNDRVYTFGDFKVGSPTGAPALFEVIWEANDVQLKIGNPNQTVMGTQTYVVSYTASGMVNPDVASSNLDEIYWNVIGTGWQMPISNVTVKLNGPVDVSRTACHMGTDYAKDCTSNSFDGTTATYTQSSLSPGQGLAVVGGWPVGTFPDAAPMLVPRTSSSSTPTSTSPFSFDHGGAYWAGGAGVASAVAAWFVAHLRRKGRDEQYVGLTPGTVPTDGEKVATKRQEVSEESDVPVEFAPPKGVPPRLAGACLREGTSDEDITATIIDLAVRGYIHMDQGKKGEFDFTRTGKASSSLDDVESHIYEGLFASGSKVTRTSLSSPSFYETFVEFRSALYQEFTAQKWYEATPGDVVRDYRGRGILIGLVGTIAAIAMGYFYANAGISGVIWFAVPCLVLGIGMIVVSRRMPVRTPAGSAVAIQSLGFKKYLERAEADQIRWEEGQDIFSEYLPYAIAFGCADHWATLIEELVAKGASVPEPEWYTGRLDSDSLVWTSISYSLDDVGTSFQGSVTAHNILQEASLESSVGSSSGGYDGSYGASGGSGFSGGGGGGGVSGGGGGTW